MAWVVANTRDAVNQIGHARQGPQLGGVPESHGPIEQGLLDLLQRFHGHAWLAPGPPGRTQSATAIGLPRIRPAFRCGPAHAKPARHGGLCFALLEQPDRPHPTSLEGFEVASRHRSPPSGRIAKMLLYYARLSSCARLDHVLQDPHGVLGQQLAPVVPGA